MHSVTVPLFPSSGWHVWWMENSNENSCVVHMQKYQGKPWSVFDGSEPMSVSSILEEQRYLELYKYGGFPGG